MKTIFTILFASLLYTSVLAQGYPMPEPNVFIGETIDATIYPNPVTESRFAISSSEEIQSIEIMNVIGQTLVKKDNEYQRLNDNVIYLDNFEKGLYLVKITFSVSPNTPVIKKMLVK